MGSLPLPFLSLSETPGANSHFLIERAHFSRLPLANLAPSHGNYKDVDLHLCCLPDEVVFF